MAIRLTTDMREGICHAMLLHRFAADIAELTAGRAMLATCIYDAAFSGVDRRRMSALPKGWLPVDQSVCASFPAVGVVKLPFNGQPLADALRAFAGKPDIVSRPFPESRKGAVLLQAEAADPMSIEAQRLSELQSTISAGIETARIQIRAALLCVATVQRLVESWPEVAPFVRELHPAGAAPVPAIPVLQLNDLLKLPVEGRA